MFFFFFGGVQPEVRKELESKVAECPRCGSDASLVEYDNVFRAFFIPIWRSAGNNPAIRCDNCNFLLPFEQYQRLASRLTPRLEQRTEPSAPLMRCWSCSSVLQPDFQFCPHCGASQQEFKA
ncbi:unnamed protein product [Calypogeia fissa]